MPVNEELLCDMDAEERNQRNRYLSYFAEASFPDYTDYDAYQMIRFAFTYSQLHNDGILLHNNDTYEMGIDADDMDGITMRFFEATLYRKSYSKTYDGGYTDELLYKDGAYWTPEGSGESCNYFAVASEMYDMHNGTFSVDFKVYQVDYDTYNDVGIAGRYYAMSEDEIEACSEITCLRTGHAVLQTFTSGGAMPYQLVEYTEYAP